MPRHYLRWLLFLLLIGAGAASIVSPDARIGLSLPLLLLAPGVLLAHLLRFCPHSPWTVSVAIWLGLSVALITLLYEWATVLHLALLPPIPGLIVGVCVVSVVWLARNQPDLPIGSTRAVIYGAGITALFLVTLALRFYQIHDLVLPAWVDSLHHALLIRITIETGQFPHTLQPYLPVDRLAYHWGYHVVSALALQVAGIPLPVALSQGMLWHGQIMSACMVVAYAGLGQYLWRRPFAGYIAGLTVGLLSVMPAFYVSWGRYTLLTGLLILPAALISLHMILRAPVVRSVLVAGLILTGLSLVHVTVFLFALIWCVALVVVERPQQRSQWIALGGVLGLTCTLTLPWLIFLAGQARIGSGASATYLAGNAAYNALPFELLWAANNQILLGLAGISALLGYLRKHVITALLVIWSALIVLLANPVVIGLPYLSLVTNETVVICLFVPCALLIGGGAALLLEWASLRLRRSPLLHRAGGVLTIASIVILAAWGCWTWQSIVRPDTILATHDDLAAIAWVAEQTPTTARFVVNTVGWLSAVDRGADGGWWLLPLAQRQVSTPPVLYTYADDLTVAAIQRTTAWLRSATSPTDAQLADFMHTYGFTYVYATIDGHPLDANRLRSSTLFEPVYQYGRVTILRLR